MISRPNILHIITHDTGRYLGCCGAPVHTPEIDAFARQAVQFDNCFCISPQCCASRSGMFSGLSPWNNGMMGQISRDWTLRPGVPYVPRLLAESGYQTVLCGIQHETAGAPRELGYRTVLPSDTRRAADVAASVTEYLQAAPDQPFFLSAGFKETHRPFPPPQVDPACVEVPHYLPDVPEVREDLARFRTSVRNADRGVERLVEALSNTGLEENTLVVFTTDHGPSFPGAKCTLFDRGTGIFLLMRGPGAFESPRRVPALLSNMDLAPTLLEYAGLEAPEEMEGRSVLPLLRGETRTVRDFVPSQLTYHAAYDPMRAVRTRRLRYVRSFGIRPELFLPNMDDSPSKQALRGSGVFERRRPFEMLFDLQQDPGESNNIATRPDRRSVLDRMRRLLLDWMERTGDPLLRGPVPPANPSKVTPPWSDTPHRRWEDARI